MSELTLGATAIAPGEFRIGRVISQSFGILSRNFIQFFVLTAIATLPYLVILLYAGSYTRSFTTNPNTNSSQLLTGGLVFLGLILLWMLLYTVSQAVVIYGVFQAMRGKPFRLSESLKRGLARFLPIIGLGICVSVAEAVGFILLVVPGIILALVLSMSLPACVVEKLGPFQSMGRSATLTKGNRWRLLGLFLLVAVVMGIIGKLLQFVFLFVGGTTVVLGWDYVWNALSSAFYSILIVVAYHDLRVAKEGVDVERIAAVFD